MHFGSPIGRPKWRLHYKCSHSPTKKQMTRNRTDFGLIHVHRCRIGTRCRAFLFPSEAYPIVIVLCGDSLQWILNIICRQAGCHQTLSTRRKILQWIPASFIRTCPHNCHHFIHSIIVLDGVLRPRVIEINLAKHSNSIPTDSFPLGSPLAIQMTPAQDNWP